MADLGLAVEMFPLSAYATVLARILALKWNSASLLFLSSLAVCMATDAVIIPIIIIITLVEEDVRVIGPLWVMYQENNFVNQLLE